MLYTYVSGYFLHLIENALRSQLFIRGMPARCTVPSVNAPPPLRECDRSMCACADKSWFLLWDGRGRGFSCIRRVPPAGQQQGRQLSSKQGLGGSTGRCIFCGTRQMAAGRR